MRSGLSGSSKASTVTQDLLSQLDEEMEADNDIL